MKQMNYYNKGKRGRGGVGGGVGGEGGGEGERERGGRERERGRREGEEGKKKIYQILENEFIAILKILEK